MSVFPSKSVGHCFIHSDHNSIFLIKKKKKKKKHTKSTKEGKSREIFFLKKSRSIMSILS